MNEPIIPSILTELDEAIARTDAALKEADYSVLWAAVRIAAEAPIVDPDTGIIDLRVILTVQRVARQALALCPAPDLSKINRGMR